ncbi:uncharacterized protein LOC135351046 [Halichondria panicea]|uniref:uncharacterized protein LOC135351046 n=1 Tax=Halichondria panicea TaxID=6063 RepID=UPI00312B87A5
MPFDCEECCKSCCYSTPFTTLVAFIFTAINLGGFFITGFYGVSQLNNISGLQNGTEVNVMGPVVGIAVVLTIVPLVLFTISSYCITGYIRDILFHGAVKCCVRSYCLNIAVMATTFVLILVWLIISIGLGGVLSFYLQWLITCPEARDACVTYVDSGFNRYEICGQVLEQACPTALTTGLAFCVSLVFAILIIIALIIVLVLHAAKFVNGRDYYDYRQTQKQDGFFSKNSR